jgi:hypothetical protein
VLGAALLGSPVGPEITVELLKVRIGLGPIALNKERQEGEPAIRLDGTNRDDIISDCYDSS